MVKEGDKAETAVSNELGKHRSQYEHMMGEVHVGDSSRWDVLRKRGQGLTYEAVLLVADLHRV